MPFKWLRRYEIIWKTLTHALRSEWSLFWKIWVNWRSFKIKKGIRNKVKRVCRERTWVIYRKVEIRKERMKMTEERKEIKTFRRVKAKRRRGEKC